MVETAPEKKLMSLSFHDQGRCLCPLRTSSGFTFESTFRTSPASRARTMIMGSVPWFVELGEFKVIKRCPFELHCSFSYGFDWVSREIWLVSMKASDGVLICRIIFLFFIVVYWGLMKHYFSNLLSLSKYR